MKKDLSSLMLSKWEIWTHECAYQSTELDEKKLSTIKSNAIRTGSVGVNSHSVPLQTLLSVVPLVCPILCKLRR